MDSAILFLKILLPVAYLVCLWSYAKLFFSANETKYNRYAQGTLILALSVHFALLALLAAKFHRCPLWTQGEALLFMAWMLGILNLISEWSADTRRLGLFTLGPASVCAVASLFSLGKILVVAPEYKSSYFIFHIVASLASYAAFCLAAVLAFLYMTLHRKLKQKTFDLTFRKLPALDKLDKLAANWSFLGTLLMIASSGIGAWWVRQDSLKGMTPRDIGILTVLALFVLASTSRRFLGWRGLRHAKLILVAFVWLIVVNLAGLHGFQF